MANPVRGVDHVGVTVPDVDEASRFFVAAFGAEIIYDLAPTEKPERGSSSEGETARLGTRPDVRWVRSQLLRLGEGPSIELFEYEDTQQAAPATASDLGTQHFALYVDDIDAVREAILRAGGTPLEGPNLLPGLESGEGNKWLYTFAPWGGIIELVTYPSPQPYEKTTDVRRWRPPAN
jgi:catechol 2,3-dioxygenase-like lactoylglutathione lyase family enzyme